MERTWRRFLVGLLVVAGVACNALSGVDDFDFSAQSAGGGGAGGGTQGFCGDGVVERDEACDDGNTQDGDGCSGCVIDVANACPGAPVVLSPPGLTTPGDLAGLADGLAPSCGPVDAPDAVYAVTPTESGTLTATLTGAFDKSVSLRSSCPSPYGAEIAELGCAAGQGAVTGKIWVHAGLTYHVIVDGVGQAFTLELRLHPCGDGVVQGLEQCDDPQDPTCIGCVACNGPGEHRDPSSQHCFLFEQSKSQTWPAARADCIAWGGDLAALSSQAEVDFVSSHPALATDVWIGAYAAIPNCSHVFVNGEPWRSAWAVDEPSSVGERCVGLLTSKANLMNDRACATPGTYLCERAPAGPCGDGIVQPGERCDDGNLMPGDGCDAQCARELAALPGEITDPATNHRYHLLTDPITWSAAKTACEASGGYLATIDTVQENTLVTGMVTANTWIGAYEGAFVDGTLFWEAPVQSCFTSWAAGEPNNDIDECVAMASTGLWSDTSCGNLLPAVCEREP